MAKCDLSIHLDEPQAAYHPGDVVRGSVEVRTDEPVRCDGLTVELRWRTHGKASSVKETAVSARLFAGEWRGGAVHRYRFELELPAGPFTYHGHYLNVVWEVYASADVPWAFDPDAEQEIALLARPGDEPQWLTAVATPSLLPRELQEAGGGEVPEPVTSSSPSLVRNALGIGCLLTFTAPALILLGAAVVRVLAFTRGEIPTTEGLVWIGVGLGMLVLLGGGLGKVVRQRIAGRKLGEVTAEVEPRLVRAGGSLRVKLYFQPRGEADLLAATARLEAEEQVVRGSGTQKRTYKKVVFEQESEIAAGRRLGRGLPFQAEGTVSIPADVPPSFLARRNRLVWTLTVRLDVARWPDWVEERAILVHP